LWIIASLATTHNRPLKNNTAREGRVYERRWCRPEKKIRHYEKNKNTHNKLVPLFVTTASGGKKKRLCVRSVVAAQLGREEQQEQDHGPAGIITTTTTTVTTTNNNSLARTVGTSGPAEAASRKREREREREREVPCETHY
jgi:hypothetical protein